jgi:cell division protein FtsB
MGETAAQTMKEIEATRARLGTEIEELEGKLPAAARLAKRAGAALAGIGAIGVATRFALRRRKGSAEDRRIRDIEKRIAKLEHRIDD